MAAGQSNHGCHYLKAGGLLINGSYYRQSLVKVVRR